MLDCLKAWNLKFCDVVSPSHIGMAGRLCLGAWSDHGEKTGGFYACNRYQAAKEEGMVSGSECFQCVS